MDSIDSGAHGPSEGSESRSRQSTIRAIRASITSRRRAANSSQPSVMGIPQRLSPRYEKESSRFETGQRSQSASRVESDTFRHSETSVMSFSERNRQRVVAPRRSGALVKKPVLKHVDSGKYNLDDVTSLADDDDDDTWLEVGKMAITNINDTRSTQSTPRPGVPGYGMGTSLDSVVLTDDDAKTLQRVDTTNSLFKDKLRDADETPHSLVWESSAAPPSTREGLLRKAIHGDSIIIRSESQNKLLGPDPKTLKLYEEMNSLREQVWTLRNDLVVALGQRDAARSRVDKLEAKIKDYQKQSVQQQANAPSTTMMEASIKSLKAANATLIKRVKELEAEKKASPRSRVPQAGAESSSPTDDVPFSPISHLS